MYTTKYPHLAEPLKLGHSGITLKNRVTSAPKWNFMASYDNHITRECVEAVIPFAKGGSSVVAMGSGFINKQLPAACHHVAGMSDPHIVVSLSQWVEAARRWGAKAEIELVPVASYFGTHEVESSVGIPMDIDINILTHDEIKQFIEDYAVAARHAMLAGTDIVNVHGAHGQLPALLFNPVFNKRTDEYGAQNFDNRCRFAVELLDAIRRECGNKIAIEYRLSCTDIVEGSPEVEEVIEFAKTIQDKIDMLLISRGCLAINKLLPLILPPTYMDHGINIEYAAKFNAALDIPVGVIGAVTFEQAEEAVASGKVEYVAMCRQNIADPDCVNKALHGREDDICPCIRCNTCISRSHFYMKSPRCAANPRYNRGMDYNYMPPITKKKKVAVIGGGPAGIEAARVAAQRGHDVTLFEKSNLLGGVFRGAAAAAFKDDLKRYLSYVIRKAHEQENLTIRMCTEATPELLDAEGFDAAIIAIGNIPFFPKWLTCKDEGRVVLVNDVDSGAAQVGNNIVIVGAGITGLETAYRFVQLGRKVTVVDILPRDQIAQTNAPINAYALFNLLENYDWDLRCETKLVDVTDDAVIVSHDGKEERLEADSVIIAMGGKANTDLIRSFEQTIPETYVVGDCNGELGNLWNSVTSAFDAAMVL